MYSSIFCQLLNSIEKKKLEEAKSLTVANIENKFFFWFSKGFENFSQFSISLS